MNYIQEKEKGFSSDFTRVIVYPASRPLGDSEKIKITNKIMNFLRSWSAHGNPLTSSYEIWYNQFVIIRVDEAIEPASGCSIDALNTVFKEIDHEYDFDFLNRMKVFYLEGEEVRVMPRGDFRANVKKGVISKNIQVFDFSKTNEKEFLSNFLRPLDESWVKNC